MKKIVFVILVIGFVLLTQSFAFGESHNHSWIAATCTAPKTCSICGETEGPSLGHDWREASYAVPKTCVRCGITEGECKDLTPREFMQLFNDRYSDIGFSFSKYYDSFGENWYLTNEGFSEPAQIQFYEGKGGKGSVIASTGTGDIDMKRDKWMRIKIFATFDFSTSPSEDMLLLKQVAVDIGNLLGDTISVSDFPENDKGFNYESDLFDYRVSKHEVYELLIVFHHFIGESN